MDNIKNNPQGNPERNKLYVAYINLDANYEQEQRAVEDSYTGKRYKATVFSDTGSNATSNEIPVILSQEEEMMLFNEYY